jgi:hypothetical protein
LNVFPVEADCPFTLHPYAGNVPALVLVAVKVIPDPEQTLMAFELMLRLGEVTGLTITIKDARGL